MMPPLFLTLRLGAFRFWLPIFLLIPFVYLTIAIFDLFFIPFLLILAPAGQKQTCAKIALIEPFRILNATKGITVEVENPHHRTFISIS